MVPESKAPADVLPHRPPFLFLDRVLEGNEQSLTACRTFRPEEEFFKGHFPGHPIVPGVLLLEGMAQTLAYMALYHQPDKVVFLTGVDRARFRKPVLPGQEVRFTVRVDGVRLGLVKAKAEARVDGVKVADATLTGYIGDAPPADAAG